MNWKIRELPWLPSAPIDFRKRFQSVKSAEALKEFAALGRYNLNSDQLILLGNKVKGVLASDCDLGRLSPFRLGVLANGTTELWIPALTGSCVRHNLALNVVAADYNQVLQAAMDPDSIVNTFKPEAILIALDYRGLPWNTVLPGDIGSANRLIENIISYYKTVRENISAASGVMAIWQTLAIPPEPTFGHLDRRVEGTQRWVVDRVNNWIISQAQMKGDCLFDIASLAEMVGSDDWFQPIHWNLYKIPFNQSLVPLYTEHLARILGALRGHTRKCLVLDLDNTLWGGAIGDDGLDGIRLGQGTGEGEAFLSVQRYALTMRDRGVMLAVCSKNNEENARMPFKKHPDMLLRESDFTVFYANWDEKALNLERIAQDINIGLDALVFLDDNPAERAHVRTRLPDVAVPELPSDPSLFVRALSSAGYFESISLVAEDLMRNAEYKANVHRTTAQAAAKDFNEYLLSLRMKAVFGPFNNINRARVAQLINKSNQFNLTTRRYTEAEVASFESDPQVFDLQLRLSDDFGDNGIISVVICRRKYHIWEIDTWLMSCRVLGRLVEQLVLKEIVYAARSEKVTHLRGKYIPTKKNDLVREHYAKLGFSMVNQEADETEWELDIAKYMPPDLPFAIERIEHKDAS